MTRVMDAPRDRCDKLLAGGRNMLKWLPVVDATRCTGSEECIRACGPASLVLVDGCAVLVRPEVCGSEEHCIEPCPEGAIRMDWVMATGDLALGRWRRS